MSARMIVLVQESLCVSDYLPIFLVPAASITGFQFSNLSPDSTLIF